MLDLTAEIGRLQASLVLYDRLIPAANAADRTRFAFHREWDAQTLAALMQQLISR